ncbi:hypothetical protein D3C71_1504690 [compost metagenome]
MRVSSAVSLAKSVSLMRLREADRFSVEVCRLATTEVKRFWIAPRSARVLLIEPSALSTTSSACWAPFTVLMSTSFSSLPGVAAALAATTALSKPVMPALVPAVAVMPLNLPSLSTLSLTEVRLIWPAVVPSISAYTPVSPILALIAVTAAETRAARSLVASPVEVTLTSAILTGDARLPPPMDRPE